MSHNINEGKRVFVVGEPAWHKLGVVLNKPATAKEAIEAAQLDYKLELQPYTLPSKKTSRLNQAVVRLDTSDEIGSVGFGYKIIQNVDAFNFFDVLVGEGQAIYHTAGALGLGERVWIMAKLPSSIIVRKDDVVDQYLLLTNSHDGGSSLKMFFTPIRVVCQNTLNLALEKGRGVSIRHTGNAMQKIEIARKTLGIAIDYYAQFEKITKQMASFKMTDELTDEYFDSVLEVNDKKEDISTVTKNKKEEMVSLFHHGKGNSGKNLWEAYNAVTEYVDHYRTIVNEDKDPTRRLTQIWFGGGADIKERAYDEALELIKE